MNKISGIVKRQRLHQLVAVTRDWVRSLVEDSSFQVRPVKQILMFPTDCCRIKKDSSVLSLWSSK